MELKRLVLVRIFEVSQLILTQPDQTTIKSCKKNQSDVDTLVNK